MDRLSQTGNLNQEKLLLQNLLLHCDDDPYNIGLFHGKMGVVLVLAHYGRVRNKRFLTHIANILLEKITTRINAAMPIGLSTGLSGIGWGIEYLIQNKYIHGNSSIILYNINNQIMQTDILRVQDNGLDNGLLGVLHYIALHCQKQQSVNAISFDEQYLINVKKRAASSESAECQSLIKCIENRACYQPRLESFINTASLTTDSISLNNGIAGMLESIISKT